MRHLIPAVELVVAAIDAANSADPNLLDGRPLAQVQGERATLWVDELEPAASAEVHVAARAHHLERWVLTRSSYPDGRAGYLRWRRDNKAHQAERAAQLVREHAPLIDAHRVSQLLLRQGLGTDTEVQLIEDVACLVFLETQFEPMIDRTEPDHLVGIVRKTLAKMSNAAVEASSLVALSPRAATIVAAASEDDAS